MVTWTIRNVSDEWDKLVNQYAAEPRRSKNRELLMLLDQVLGQEPKRKRMSVAEMTYLANATAALPGPSNFDGDAFLYDENGLPK